MLKISTAPLTAVYNAKCGEIFCHSSTEFLIFCSFCNIKCFTYDDFLLHFRNEHFENELLKPDDNNVEFIPTKYQPIVKVEIETEVNSELEHDNNSSCDDLNDLPREDYEENRILELPKTNKLSSSVGARFRIFDTSSKKKITIENKIITNGFNETDNEEYTDGNEDIDIDDDYKPEDVGEIDKGSDIGDKPKCEICERTYKSDKMLDLHNKRYHSKTEIEIPETYKCIECIEEFKQQRLLDAHLVKMHNGFKCPHCDKRYKAKYLLARHVYVHSGVRNFVCDIDKCEKRFFSRRYLLTHKRVTHAESKRFVCDVCGYSCMAQSTLRTHYRKHTGEKPYSCQICEKKFSTSSLLSEHKATHSTERPYKCDICGASFSRPKALYHHKPLHLGIKKFICKHCGHAFAQAAGLAGHVRKHKEGLL